MRRFGIALISAGAVVWTAGAVAWISGVWVTLPPDAVRLLVLSLAGATGGLLVGTGALLGRTSRVRHSQVSDHIEAPTAPSKLAESDIALSRSRVRDVRMDERIR